MADAMIIELQLLKQAQVIQQMQKVADEAKKMNQALGRGGRGSLTTTGAASTKAVATKTAQTFQQQLMGVLKSSRFSAGGGLMPLVGQTLNLIPGPFRMAAAAVALLAENAKQAAAHIGEMRQSQFVSGGSQRDVIQAAALGGAVGISGTAMAQMSRTLSERLQSSGWAQTFGQRAGLTQDYGVLSNVNKMKNLQKAIGYVISKNTSLEEAERAARELGIEDALRLRDLSEATKKILMEADPKYRTALTDTNDVANAAKFNAELDRMQKSFEDVKTVAGQIGMPVITAGLQALAAALQTVATGLKASENTLRPVQDFFKALGDMRSHNMEDFRTDLKRMFQDIINPGGAKARDDQEQAQREHTAAMREHAKVIAGSGTYGGGERAANAIPHGIGGANFNQYKGMIAALGAFQL